MMPSHPPGWQTFFADLKRRRVFRVMGVYGVVGFVVLQAVDLLIPVLLLPDWTYRLIGVLLLAGLPIATALAWVFEVTPDGVRRTEAAAAQELASLVAQPRSQRWPAGVFALLGVVLLVAGGWWTMQRGRGGDAADATPIRSVAVLPFQNMSEDRSNEYFSDGLAEELLNVLAGAGQLKVAARTSAFAFKGQNVDVREIGQKLGVEAVVEGSVRKMGDRVRITAQLIKVADGFHLWSDTYDRELADIFAVQEEIAASIAQALQVTLGLAALDRTQRGQTTNLEAFDLYLLGRQRWWTRLAPAMREAIAYFEQAIAKDSTFALAYAGLADSWATLPFYAYEEVTPDSAYARARAAAAKAAALKPDLPEVHVTLGMIAFQADWQWEKGERELRRAVELAPSNAAALLWHSNTLVVLRRHDEALRAIQRALELDPLFAVTNHVAGDRMLQAGRTEEAVALFRRANELSPAFPLSYWRLATALVQLERYDEAAEAMRKWGGALGYRDADGLAIVAHAARDESLKPRAIAALNALAAATSLSKPDLVFLYAMIDAVDEAVEAARLGVATHNPWVVYYGTIQAGTRTHTDPRFRAILQRIRLPLPPG